MVELSSWLGTQKLSEVDCSAKQREFGASVIVMTICWLPFCGPGIQYSPCLLTSAFSYQPVALNLLSYVLRDELLTVGGTLYVQALHHAHGCWNIWIRGIEIHWVKLSRTVVPAI